MAPAPHYPAELPIVARKDEILAALEANQVLVVAGETGSGKSTQLPKMCLEAGRGVAGLIGHTQPRRIAARSVAERVAEELGTTLGRAVGYKVRFTDRVSGSTLVKVMTDGVLLAELHGDPELRNYDTLIIDEAHERSLNIDFILGYLKRLLPSRPDLKVIVTSATIDTERFSQHFDGAPVIDVPGRTYPVEIRYRPMAEPGEDGNDEEPMDEVQAVCEAVADLCKDGPGDILVFLPGEREIRDTAEALAKAHVTGLDVLALYGRLSSAEQHRIFEPHTGRRAVLSTNVAETSLTVPGIRYVVDLGTARISRYGRRTKVQRLPIERISQASANQRAGRCGRLGPGVCVRLYSEEDFATRRPFTEPEILRTNLASVILQMAAIGLGDIENFPFMEPPDRRNVADGIALLEELGAFVAPASRPGPLRSRPRVTRCGSVRLAASWPSCRSTRGSDGWCSKPTASIAFSRFSLLRPDFRSRIPVSVPQKSGTWPPLCTPGLPTRAPISCPTCISGTTWNNDRLSSVRASSAGYAEKSSSLTSGPGNGRTFKVSWPRYRVRLG